MKITLCPVDPAYQADYEIDFTPWGGPLAAFQFDPGAARAESTLECEAFTIPAGGAIGGKLWGLDRPRRSGRHFALRGASRGMVPGLDIAVRVHAPGPFSIAIVVRGPGSSL